MQASYTGAGFARIAHRQQPRAVAPEVALRRNVVLAADPRETTIVIASLITVAATGALIVANVFASRPRRSYCKGCVKPPERNRRGS